MIRKEYGENEIEVRASSKDSESPEPNVIIEHNDQKDEFWTENIPNSWVLIDLGERKANVSHYSLETYEAYPGQSHLKSWVLEGSNDGEEWTEMDKEDDREELNGLKKSATFQCSRSGLFSLIRLRIT